ncbi:hypothetical protein [Spirosoma sp. KNUC1025]|uniref:hypothetical protein n=1 Tax=Spirosoma sp. KNUC1025 TaxID=2894082 RepID=UPI001E3BC933|nr:hypothetical protein [Spirosoma sp. KNUC1025]UFH57687.1 hypothetical protein LN737_32180 [Spirosoma sp. KNUC1025]
MKRIVFTLFMLSLLTRQGFSQSSKSEIGTRLQTLLEQASPNKSVGVHVLEKESSLQISDHVIPLAETTFIRCEKQNGKYAVKFFLQAGTAITRTEDPTFRRAYWSLDLATKQSCQEFMALFNQLRTEVKKG